MILVNDGVTGDAGARQVMGPLVFVKENLVLVKISPGIPIA